MAPYPPDRRTYIPSRPPTVPPDIRDVKARAARARAAVQATIPKRKPVVTAPTAAPSMPPWYLTPEQQIELARKQAEAFYGPQLDAYKRQQEYLSKQHAAQQEGLKALYAVLAQSFGNVPGEIQGIYREAAQDQSAFGKGYSQGLQLAQDQSAGDTNKLLEQIGAPEGQMQNPGTGAADATYALGGTIPANTLEQQGAAFASAASFLPVKAGLQGQMEFLKAIQQANQEDQALSDEIASVAGQIPGKAQDYLGDIQSQQAAYAKDEYQRSQDALKAATPKIVSGPDGLYALTRNSRGGWDFVPVGPRKQTAPKPPSTFGSSATGIYAWRQTKNGWEPVLVDAPKGAAEKPPTPVKLPNGNLAVWQKTKNGWNLVTIAKKGTDPTKPVITGAGGLPMTNTQINDASATVKMSINTAKKKGIPITEVLDAFENEAIPAQIYLPIVMKAYGIPSNLNPSNLRNMTTQRLYRLAAVLGYRPPTVGKKTIVYGVDATGASRRLTPDEVAALQRGEEVPGIEKVYRETTRGHPGGGLNKNELVAWIGNHLPKSEAPVSGAQFSAYVTVSPSADRAGVKIDPAVVNFVGKIGSIYGKKLTIGTGSNHNQYVKGTDRQSDHWFGEAADIPAAGAELTKLGQAALIAAGADPNWAKKQRGGVFNIGGYNILFNTNVGGNHYNHLHVGMGRILGRSFNQTVATSTGSTRPVHSSMWPSMILSGAERYGLDPQAVLAVARSEGLSGEVGDNGTSFGPFQLHIGGALPRGRDRAWAESPAGIEYALRQIARVAKGKRGLAAIRAIVNQFERPANKAAEIQRAWAYYQGSMV